MAGLPFKPFIEGDPSGFRVGARSTETDYVGPIADIWFNADWLYIVTDEYEGVAMLNIETLPALIEVLQRIDATIAVSRPPVEGE